MKTVTININGKETEITLTKEQLEQINKSSDSMLEVYKYHNTTEEEFEQKFKDFPEYLKAYQQEVMIVSFYNKGWKPNWNNLDEHKYFPYFYMEYDNFRLSFSNYFGSGSDVSSRLCFRRKNTPSEK